VVLLAELHCTNVSVYNTTKLEIFVPSGLSTVQQPSYNLS